MGCLIEHYEKDLGTIQHGWSQDASGIEMPFQVVECYGGVIKEIASFATLGLSKCELSSPNSTKIIRHELLLAAPLSFGTKNIPGVLQQVGNDAISRQCAYLRGDVIGPRGQLFEGTNFEAFYVAIPVYFPDSLKFVRGEEGYDIVIAWLVPITRPEAIFIRKQGWEEFEELLEQKDPNLFDFKRTSIVGFA